MNLYIKDKNTIKMSNNIIIKEKNIYIYDDIYI